MLCVIKFMAVNKVNILFIHLLLPLLFHILCYIDSVILIILAATCLEITDRLFGLPTHFILSECLCFSVYTAVWKESKQYFILSWLQALCISQTPFDISPQVGEPGILACEQWCYCSGAAHIRSCLSLIYPIHNRFVSPVRLAKMSNSTNLIKPFLSCYQ